MELLYTGETQASHSELDKIKVGLNLLGILHPGQGHQPDQPAVTCAPVPEVSPSPLAEGVINSSQVFWLASTIEVSNVRSGLGLSLKTPQNDFQFLDKS